MKRIGYWAWLTAFPMASAFFVTGCGTIPPREVHAGAGTLRTVLIDSTPQGQSPQHFSVGGSLSRDAGTVDTGRAQGSTNVEAQLELRVLKTLALGFEPYLSFVDGSLDAKSHLGTNFYARWRAIETKSWAFSLYPGFGYGKNRAVEHGSTCVVFSCVETADMSEGKVETIDGGVSVISSRYLDERNVVSAIPSIYFTHSKVGYTVNNVNRFTDSRTSVNYALRASYGHIFDLDGSDSLLSFSAGAATHRGLGPYYSKTHVVPLVQLSYQISLGGRIDGRE